MEKSRFVFQRELGKLRQDTFRMIDLAKVMIEKSISSFVNFDVKEARKIIRMDDEVDMLDRSIERRGIEILATQQPMAKDLRLISGVLKIITDIERLGDYSVDNAKLVSELTQKPSTQFVKSVVKMKKTGLAMLDSCLTPLKNGNPEKLEKVILMDDVVDREYYKVQDIAMKYLKDPVKNKRDYESMIVLIIARNLERIADHITNICERTYYILKGEHIELHKD